MVKIYQQKLGLSTEDLQSIKMSFSTCRVVSFKLKKQINIDDLLDRETFKIERTFMRGTEIKTDVIDCKKICIICIDSFIITDQ